MTTGVLAAVGVMCPETGGVVETVELKPYIVPPICYTEYTRSHAADTQSDMTQAIGVSLNDRPALHGPTAGREAMLSVGTGGNHQCRNHHQIR